MRWDTDISDAALDMARRLRADGASWERIEEAVGSTMHVIRTRIDPSYRVLRNSQVRTARDYRRERRFERLSRMTTREELAAVGNVPADTRSATARMFGDPLPGRSALDRRQEAH